MSMDRLVRFRADPSKVRSAIRRAPCGWLAYLTPVKGGAVAWGRDRSPVRALVKAYREARDNGMDGIDSAMGRAYVHPQWRP